MKTRIFIHCSTPVATPSRRAHPGSRKNHQLFGSAMTGLALMVVSGSLHAQAVSLGAAENFTIVTSQGLTNNGLTVITGNVALSPLPTISGFDFSTPPGGGRVIGTVHYNDGLAAQAQTDSLTAFNTLAGKAYLPANNLTGQDLGGLTLTPGVYHFNTSVGLTGNMILNTQADPNAVFIFQIGSTLTAAVGSSITVIGAGAGTASNIFWQVGSSATLNANTAFTGNILAQASVSLGTGASLVNGRVIALDGAVTLLGNSLTAPGLPPLPPEGSGRFWNGSASNLWSGTNWSESAAGLDQVTLGGSPDVVFSVNSGAIRQNTILDSDTTISSLTFNDSAAVTIGGTNVLTLSATGLTAGIKVNEGAGLVTIRSGLVLGTRSQFITVNNEAGMLISGVIAGSNPLTKTGTGLLILTGRETYTGATVVTGGTLQIGNGMTAGSSIASSSSVLINNSGKLTSVLAIDLKSGETFRNSVTDNGQIRWIAAGTNTQSSSSIFSGSGNMRITAPGNTILLGSNSFSGGTTINPNANVLVGTSTAFGSGVLNIKNAHVDTYRSALLDINVGGYVQSSGEIRMHLQGTTAGSYTRYNVAGTAKLSGGKVFVYDATGDYVPQGGDKQNILHTTGGLTGKFASDSPYSKFYNADLDRNLFYHRGDTLLYPTITYKAKDAYVKWVQGSFGSLTNLDLTPNQTSVARSLDGYTRQHPGDPDGVVTYLNQQNISDLPGLYDLIAPDELTAIFQMGFSAAEIQNTNIKRHLEQVRHEPVAASPVQYTPSEKGSKGGMVEQTAAAPETHRWSVFLEGTGGSAEVGSTYNADGYEFDTMGMTLGADLRVNDHLVVGILGSYANSDVSLVNRGSIDSENYKGAVYATAFANGFHVDALLGAGYNTYDTKRSSLLGYANGSPDAWELDTLLNVGYDFHVDNWTFSPNASVAYTQVNLNHFTETGSLTPLQYPDQDQSSLRTDLGLSISYTATLGAMKVTPQVRISWQHEFLDNTQSMDSRFASGNGPLFTVDGPQMDRDRALIGAGVNVQITPTVAVYGYYDGQLGSSNYTSNTVSAGIKVDF